jgi:AraC-like DNA-binding protein
LTVEIVNLLQALLASACLTAGLMLMLRSRLRPLAALLVLFAIHMAFNALEETHVLPAGVLVTPALGFAYGPLVYLFVRRLVIAPPLDGQQIAFHFAPPLVALFLTPWIDFIRAAALVSFVGYGLLTVRLINRYHAETASFRSDAVSLRLLWVFQVFAGFAALTVIDAVRILTQPWQSPKIAAAAYASILLAGGGLLGALVWRAVTRPEYFKGLSHPPGSPPPSLPNASADAAAHLLRIEQAMLSGRLHRRPHLTLSDLASATSLTEREVSSAINGAARVSFCDYVNARRVRDVCGTLAAGGTATVLEVAFDAGFTSKSSFNAAFKRETGMTPTEYRRQNASKPQTGRPDS